MGESQTLYLEIAESIRRRITSGEFAPGDRLPAIRDMARQWNCTPGTVSRAYAQLAHEGLVVSRRGAGTRVAEIDLQPATDEAASRRWAVLVNQAEGYLLNAINSGYTPTQAEAALSVAIGRWESLRREGAPAPQSTPPQDTLRFVGSHDLAVEVLAHLLVEYTRVVMSTEYVGSLGGLIALARQQADVAGIHLWDEVTDTYNVPFVQRVLPGRRVLLITLAHRSLGLILPPDNPQGLHRLEDLTRPGVRLVNRQPGSGTRVWLDAQIKARGIRPEAIAGYERAESTHLAVAEAVADGHISGNGHPATVGLGIRAAADAYGLAFVPLARERYDLALLAETWETSPARALADCVASARLSEALRALGGYDLAETGHQTWVG